MKVIKQMWFTGRRGLVGIIIGEDRVTGQRKAYIGSGDGDDEAKDTGQIAANGAKFLLPMAQELVDLLSEKDKE